MTPHELSACIRCDDDVVELDCWTCPCGGISMALLSDTQVMCLNCMGIQTRLTAHAHKEQH